MADQQYKDPLNGVVKALVDNGDGTFSEKVSASLAAPTDGSASGVISTQNLVPAGAATANSAVEINVAGRSTLGIQTVGTYTGALSLQLCLVDGTWITVGGTSIIPETTGVGAATIASAAQGVFQADVSGALKARITALAAVTGSVTVTLRATTADGVVSIGAPLPAGAATIGSVNLGTAGVAATSIGKAEDAVAASGDTGVFQLGVRRDAPTISASAAGDYNELAVTQHGALYTQAVDGMKRTYAASVKLTTVVAGQVLEIAGAASTTVEINRITLTLFGTAAGKMDFTVNKRSTAATGGTSTAPTKVPYNAADAAAASTLKAYTVSPTVGTVVGPVRQGMLYTGASVPSDRIKIESGSYSKSLTLTTAAQAITVDLAGSVPAGAELAIDIEWTEF